MIVVLSLEKNISLLFDFFNNFGFQFLMGVINSGSEGVKKVLQEKNLTDSNRTISLPEITIPSNLSYRITTVALAVWQIAQFY